MGNESVSLNLKGEKVVLKEGQDINKIKTRAEKLLNCIFDNLPKNNKLELSEIYDAQDFKEGVFNVFIQEDKAIVKYEEDTDKDGKIDYTSTWTFDENDNWTERTKDADGDGKVDEKYTRTHHNNGQVSQHIEEYYTDGKLTDKAVLKFNEQGEQTDLDSTF